jgi:glycosyltransferase involved in cell wall biosynthesis
MESNFLQHDCRGIGFMGTNVEVSVIIASYNSIETIESCLKSLEEQTATGSFEVIVVDSSTDGTGELVERRFPRAKVYRFQQRKFCGDARNIGICVAKGKIIAFIDADCQAEQNWIEEILKAHELPYPAIGGAIANANPESYVGWAAYFCEFSQWMPGTQPKWLDDIAGANMSYKKPLFDEYGEFIEGTYCSDTDFHWRIGRDGHRLRFVPSILVSHQCIDALKQFLAHEFHHGRSFGQVRVQGGRFSRWKRAVYVAWAPLVPLMIFSKVAFNNIRNRVYLPRFIAALPLLVPGIICWSVGEVVSYAGL